MSHGALGGCLVVPLLVQAFYRQHEAVLPSQWNKLFHDIPPRMPSACFIAGYGGLPDSKPFCQLALSHARV